MLICDSHADTLYAMQNAARDPSEPYDVTKERLLSGGGTRVQALALFTGAKGLRDEDEGIIARELVQLAVLKGEGFAQIEDIDEAVSGRPNIMLTVEGGEVFHDGIERVDEYRALGVRIAALVWNNENLLARPAVGGLNPGLTEYGARVVRRMNDIGMAVDVSHMNEAGVSDVFSICRKPPMASHSCARALCDHPRNLSDEQLRRIFDMDGYVGVNFYPVFLSPTGKASVQTVLRHIDHMLSLGGEGHVGMGSDFDGIESHPRGLEHAGKIHAFIKAMRRHGYGERTVKGIAGESFAAYMKRI